MLRPLRIGLALLAIFAIAFVLITPDPDDDVPGILKPSHLGKSLRLAVSSIDPPAVQSAMVLLPTPLSSTQQLSASELLDLVCGVASRAKRVANLLRRELDQQIPHPPGIFAWDVVTEPEQTGSPHQLGKIDEEIHR